MCTYAYSTHTRNTVSSVYYTKTFLESSGCRTHPLETSGYWTRFTHEWYISESTLVPSKVTNQTKGCIWGHKPTAKKLLRRYIYLLMYIYRYQIPVYICIHSLSFHIYTWVHVHAIQVQVYTRISISSCIYIDVRFLFPHACTVFHPTFSYKCNVWVATKIHISWCIRIETRSLSRYSQPQMWWFSQMQIGWYRILILFLTFCWRTRILPIGHTISTGYRYTW